MMTILPATIIACPKEIKEIFEKADRVSKIMATMPSLSYIASSYL
jgi:hypothetical protein